MKLVKKNAEKHIESSDLERICKKFDLSKEIVELLFIRNIDDDEKIEKFLHPSVKDFYNPFLLSGMREAVNIINHAIKKRKKITIFGDYDVDGVSATALLILLFKDKGIKVSHFMPNRYVDGYGLSNDAIDKIKKNFGTELLITVDCGISCHDEVEYAKSLGMEVIITDHHDIPDILPETTTINAKLPNQEYPFHEICGTGVAFKLAQALCGLNYAMKFLPIVCIATIADIVPLVDENRAIVKLGLDNFFQNLPKGIEMLYHRLEMERPTAMDISFKLTPKLNASGRMGNADASLQLYLEKDEKKIQKLIDDILEYNIQRQELCNVVYEQCQKMLENKNLANSRAIVLASKNWDSGVLGIVAARLTEEYWRPTFLFAIEDDICSGSGRSIPNINIHFCLNQMKDFLESFGGHTMAAGVKIKEDKLNEFETQLNAVLQKNYPADLFIPQKKFDIDIDINKINKDFIQDLDILEPLGSENPRPLFKIQFNKSNATPMRNHPNHLMLNLNNIKAVGFNLSKWQNVLNQNTLKEAIVELGIDVYRGTESTRMFLKNISPSKNLKIGDNEKIIGEYLKQIEFSTNKFASAPIYSVYDNNNIKELVKNFDLATGTLFVSHTYGSFTAFANDNDLNKYVSSYFYNDILEDKGHNVLVLNPNNKNNFSNYNNIVFLDAVLDKNYIAFFNSITNAKIYVPKTLKIQQKLLNELDLERETFGFYYTLILNNLKNNRRYLNLYDFYQKCKSKIGTIKFVEFSLVEMVLKELGILNEIENENEMQFSINKNISTKLDNSIIYNKAKELKSGD